MEQPAHSTPEQQTLRSRIAPTPMLDRKPNAAPDIDKPYMLGRLPVGVAGNEALTCMLSERLCPTRSMT